MKNKFEEYYDRLALNNIQTLNKVNHIKRVTKNSIKLATQLGLSEKDIKLAEIIGYLHDIGGFEQLNTKGVFRDSVSFDHGNFGHDLLFVSGLIHEFPAQEADYEIIKAAVKNHNKLVIENDLDERTLLHCKIIRDADKMDLFHCLKEDDTSVINKKGNDVSLKVKEAFFSNNCVNYADVVTYSDCLIAYLAQIFDFNFDITFKSFIEMNILDVFRKLLPKEEIFEKILAFAKKYIDKKERVIEC